MTKYQYITRAPIKHSVMLRKSLGPAMTSQIDSVMSAAVILTSVMRACLDHQVRIFSFVNLLLFGSVKGLGYVHTKPDKFENATFFSLDWPFVHKNGVFGHQLKLNFSGIWRINVVV